MFFPRLHAAQSEKPQSALQMDLTGHKEELSLDIRKYVLTLKARQTNTTE